ncbi:MAG: MBL fold metallo-hydrolase [Candidatus Neomarinimicrobiota bacterium]
MIQIRRNNRLAGLYRATGIALLLLFSLNCAGMAYRVAPDPGLEPLTPADLPYSEVIQVQYLGTGGYLFQRDGYGLLTGSLYSNPGLLRVGFWHISADTVLINQLHPHRPKVRVEAILIGHAHYDHLLDVPYVAYSFDQEATIYGNASVGRIMAAANSSLWKRTKVLDTELAREGLPGVWFYVADSTIRFMAIESDHGPHALGIHVMRGEVKEGLKAVPKCAWAWREGETFAYLIDFLSPEGSIDFRIHFQDATSHYPLGAPPDFAPQDTHRIDLAIVSVGSWFQVPDYPGAFLRNHQPRHVILGHWENFFRSPLKPPRQILYSTRLWSFIPYIERNLPADADWLLPKPGATYWFTPARP